MKPLNFAIFISINKSLMSKKRLLEMNLKTCQIWIKYTKDINDSVIQQKKTINWLEKQKSCEGNAFIWIELEFLAPWNYALLVSCSVVLTARNKANICTTNGFSMLQNLSCLSFPVTSLIILIYLEKSVSPLRLFSFQRRKLFFSN